MKKIKVIYWVCTILFGGYMLFSAIPDIINHPDAVAYMTDYLGYPPYFTPFIGWAKTLGVLAILLPGFPKVKEWAYAGLFFDLIGATYSVLSVEGLQASMLFMLIPILLGISSYVYYHRLRKARMLQASVAE